MKTIGWFFVIVAGFVIRGIAKGRDLSDLPTDLGDFFTSAIQGNVNGVKEVASRASSVPADILSMAGQADTAARLDAIGDAQTSTAARTVVQYARAQIGKPYVWGKDGPDTFDCSGLTRAAYLQVGVSLPHFTGTQVLQGHAVAKADLRPGDLVFPNAGHVQLYSGSGNVIEAPRAGLNVREVPMWGFLTARRVL